MADSPLIIKSKTFALDVIQVCRELRVAKCESALINQFLRSGTSIGANIREAFYAHGKADFIAKLQIALKECSETEYWIELVLESGYYHDTIFRQSFFDCLAVPGKEQPSFAWFDEHFRALRFSRQLQHIKHCEVLENYHKLLKIMFFQKNY